MIRKNKDITHNHDMIKKIDHILQTYLAIVGHNEANKLSTMKAILDGLKSQENLLAYLSERKKHKHKIQQYVENFDISKHENLIVMFNENYDFMFLRNPYLCFRHYPIENDISEYLGNLFKVKRNELGKKLVIHLLEYLKQKNSRNKNINGILEILNTHTEKFKIGFRKSELANLDIVIESSRFLIGIETKRKGYGFSDGQPEREAKSLHDESARKNISFFLPIFLDQGARSAGHQDFVNISFRQLSHILDSFRKIILNDCLYLSDEMQSIETNLITICSILNK